MQRGSFYKIQIRLSRHLTTIATSTPTFICSGAEMIGWRDRRRSRDGFCPRWGRVWSRYAWSFGMISSSLRCVCSLYTLTSERARELKKRVLFLVTYSSIIQSRVAGNVGTPRVQPCRLRTCNGCERSDIQQDNRNCAKDRDELLLGINKKRHCYLQLDRHSHILQNINSRYETA